MRRPTTLVTLLVAPLLGLVLGLPLGQVAPAVAAPSPGAERTTGCQRTLASYPVLVVPGARRAAVRTLQCALNDAGYGPVVVDGWYGPQTRAGVRRVEAGFEGAAPRPDRVNNGFWVLLFGQHLPARVLKPGDRGPAVRTLQRALRAAGAQVAVTGKFGAGTGRAVRAYQRSQRVRVTGVVDRDTHFFLPWVACCVT